MKMNRKLFACFFAFMLALAFVFIAFNPSAVTFAAAEEGDENPAYNIEDYTEVYFRTIAEGQQFLVTVEWETQRPLIVFRSPSGKYYSYLFENEEGTRFTEGEKDLTYYIEDAEAGDWYMYYDKLDNENIYVGLMPATSPFVVYDVTTKLSGLDRLTVNFNVQYAMKVSVRYKLYLTDANGGSATLLYEGNGYSNELNEAEVDLSRFGSYDHYRIKVDAYFDAGNGLSVDDSALSEEFKYISPYVEEFSTNITSVYARPDKFSVTINWEPNWNRVYYIMVYENGGSEPVDAQEIDDSSVKSYTHAYESDVKVIRFEMYEKQSGGVYSNPYVVEVDLDAIPVIEFEDGELTNRDVIRFSYRKVDPEAAINVFLNEVTIEHSIKDRNEGVVDLTLSEGANAIKIQLQHKDKVWVEYEKEIFYDNLPPRIYMLQDYSSVISKTNTYDIAGTVTGASHFFVNGQEVKLEDDNTFVYTLKLSKGENVFTAEATDPAGNKVAYVGSISLEGNLPTPTPAEGEPSVTPGDDDSDEPAKGEKKSILEPIMPYLAAIVAALAGIVLLVLVFILDKKKTNTKLTTAKKIVGYIGFLDALVTGFAAYKYFTIKAFVNSVKFIDLAYESVAKAKIYLDNLDLYKLVLIISGSVLGVCLLAFLVLVIIGAVKGKKSKAEDVSKEEIPTEVQEEITVSENENAEPTTENVTREEEKKDESAE